MANMVETHRQTNGILLLCGVFCLDLNPLQAFRLTAIIHRWFMGTISISAKVVSDVYLLILFIRKLLYTDSVCQSGGGRLSMLQFQETCRWGCSARFCLSLKE